MLNHRPNLSKGLAFHSESENEQENDGKNVAPANKTQVDII